MLPDQLSHPASSSPLLTVPEAAAYCRVSKAFLNKDRVYRLHGIPFIKLGRRILYRLSDLDAFIDSKTVLPCGQHVIKAEDCK